jgi:hypothetical protein
LNGETERKGLPVDKEAWLEDVAKPLLAGRKVLLISLVVISVLMVFGNLLGLFKDEMPTTALAALAIPAAFFGYFFGRAVGQASGSLSWQLLAATGVVLFLACQIPAAVAATFYWAWMRHHSEAAFLIFFVAFGLAAWKIWDSD